MRQSQLFTRTKRENPSDEVAKNAQLLIRGGYIFKEMAGVYTILPLGYRVLEKIVKIVKEEMDAIGGVQMKTSALQAKEVWEKTNRWDDAVVDNWFKTTLKNGTEVGLSFTNEEAYSHIMKEYISSYKDLPVYPYDFKTIFRNEARSKSGIMRGREFYWKALYSFSKDQAQHDEFYEKAKVAYMNVYRRVGLVDHTYMTFASGGTFSKFSHEFQTISEAGEDTIYIDSVTKESWNKEIALGTPDNKNINDQLLELKEVPADRSFSIEESCKLYNCESWQVLKSFVFFGEKTGMAIACVRGDLEVNILHLADLVGESIRAATSEELLKNNLSQGFISPIGLNAKFKIYADESVKTVRNFITGANKNNVDFINANFERDFTVDVWGNFVCPNESFLSINGNPISEKTAIEVGNIFSLGSKFSEPLGLTYKNESGEEIPVFMGSYGIGITRLMGTIVEVLSDDKGIIWPASIAPFAVHLVGLGEDMSEAENLYKELTSAGIEVLFDDRKGVMPGEKFADADLLGMPIRIVVSKRSLENGGAEIKKRNESESKVVPLNEVISYVKKVL